MLVKFYKNENVFLNNQAIKLNENRKLFLKYNKSYNFDNVTSANIGNLSEIKKNFSFIQLDRCGKEVKVFVENKTWKIQCHFQSFNYNNLLCRFIQITLLLSVMYCTFVPLSAQLSPVSPIIWSRLDAPLLKGEARISAFITYVSPCSRILEEAKNLRQKKILQECNKLFDQKFRLALNGFCSIEAKPSKRQKRYISIVTVFSIFLVGVANVATRISNMLTGSELQNQINTIYRSHNELIDVVETLSRDLNNKLKEHEEFAIGFVFAASALDSNLMATKNRLDKISEKWKKGIVSPDLVDLFNLTLICGGGCSLKHAKPIFCNHYPSESLVKIQFDVKVLDQERSLIKANPFKLYLEQDNFICVYEYIGPRIFIVYNNNTRVCPYNLDQTSDFYILPKVDECLAAKEIEDWTVYWSKNCKEKLFTYETIQVRYTPNDNYIYCKGENITIFNTKISCPDYVFKLSSNLNFSVGSYLYTTTQQEIYSELRFEADITTRMDIMFPVSKNIYLKKPNLQSRFSFITLFLMISIFLNILNFLFDYWYFRKKKGKK